MQKVVDKNVFFFRRIEMWNLGRKSWFVFFFLWIAASQDEFKHLAVFPCKLHIYPENVFKSRDPIIVGVNVEAGFLKEGTVLCVPSKDVSFVLSFNGAPPFRRFII